MFSKGIFSEKYEVSTELLKTAIQKDFIYLLVWKDRGL